MKKKIIILSIIILVIFVVIFFFSFKPINYSKLNKVYISSGTKEKGLYYNYENNLLKSSIFYGDIKVERKLKIKIDNKVVKVLKQYKFKKEKLNKNYVTIKVGKKNYYSNDKKLIKKLEELFEKTYNDNNEKIESNL